MADRARSMMGGATHKSGGRSKTKSSSKGKAHSVHVRRAKGGGFIAVNHPDPSDPNATPDEYAIANQAQLAQHINSSLGDQPDSAAAQAPSAAPGGDPSAGGGTPPTAPMPSAPTQ